VARRRRAFGQNRFQRRRKIAVGHLQKLLGLSAACEVDNTRPMRDLECILDRDDRLGIVQFRNLPRAATVQ
jgi:hypothetical protein